MIHSEIGLNRRALLGAAVAAGAAGLAACATAPPHQRDRFGTAADLPLDDPDFHLDLFRRMSASNRDGEEAFLRYSGTTFAMIDGAEAVPLYGMEGFSPSRTIRQPDGTVRFLAMEFGLHTDLRTGDVLEEWTNPLTDETLPVWHLRNGPLNYPIDPNVALNSAGWRLLVNPVGMRRDGFFMPVDVEGDTLVVALDAQARRKNPLDPAEWPRASSGAELVYSEHNTWRMALADVLDPDVHSLPAMAAWHSHKQWRPWMMMEGRPGRIYNHLVAHKVSGPEALPPKIRAYAEIHFPDFLSAPKEWTGAYQDNWRHFIEARSPA
ncbi:MAG: DUF1838 family protein [Pseudomonadota bacterium]